MNNTKSSVDYCLGIVKNQKLVNNNEVLVNELAKAQIKFIMNNINTKWFDTIKVKVKKAERLWDSIIRQFFKWKKSSWYKRIPKQVPLLTAYIVANYGNLPNKRYIYNWVDVINSINIRKENNNKKFDN